MFVATRVAVRRVGRYLRCTLTLRDRKYELANRQFGQTDRRSDCFSTLHAALFEWNSDGTILENRQL